MRDESGTDTPASAGDQNKWFSLRRHDQTTVWRGFGFIGGGSSVSLLIYSPLHSPTVLGDTATEGISADQIVSTFSFLPRNRSSRARDANVVLMCCRCYYTGPACCRHRLRLQPTRGVTKTTQLLRSSTTWLPTEFLMSVCRSDCPADCWRLTPLVHRQEPKSACSRGPTGI